MRALPALWMMLLAGCPVPQPTEPTTRTEPTTTAVGCFETEDVAPLDESPQGATGAVRTVADPEGVELCSASAGFDTEDDAHQFAFQRFTGDVDAQATLRALERGTAGLVLRADDQATDRSRVLVGVRAGDDGALRVVTRIRPHNGGAETERIEGPVVTLPVRLRVVRAGDWLQADVAEGDAPFVTTWSGSVAGQGLAKVTGAIGLAQASNGDDVGTATFGPLTFGGRDVPPPDITECLPTSVPNDASIEIVGLNLDTVTGARIAGEPATIEAKTSTSLRLRKRPGRAKYGVVGLDTTGWGVVHSRQALAAVGEPFVRGDLDGDGGVDLDDLADLVDAAAGTASVVDCPEAADIDGDGDVDGNDVTVLRLHLSSDGPPPAAPYPDPGAPEGAVACRRDAAPTVVSVLGADGSTLSSEPLAEGDQLIVVVSDLPEPADRLDVRFGDVRTRQVADGATGIPNALLLEVGTVPTSGAKCPSWFVDDGAAVAPGDVARAVARFSRTGIAYEVGDALPSPRCPTFTSSGLSNLVQSRFDGSEGHLFHPIRASAWSAGDQIHLELDLPLPSVWGSTQGGRTVSLVHRVAGTTYEEQLERLAADLRSLLGEDPDCDCDVDVQARPSLGGIVFEPCDPDIAEPPGPLVPDLPVRPVPIDKWSGTSWKQPAPDSQPVSCVDVGTYQEDPRQFMWCRFADDIVRVEADGEPAWTDFYDGDILHLIPQHIPSLGFLDINPSPPLGRDHAILYNWPALWSAYEGHYYSACAQAARREYCSAGLDLSMPAFDPDGRVLKTFWRPLDALPATADPDDYYSVQPPGEPRQYLVGLHVNVATGENRAYWHWATFWVPKPASDTTNKAGQPLVYNTDCIVGTAADQPKGLPAPWTNYAMCTDATGDTACGNPWTANECEPHSCTECHEESWSVQGPLTVAWFPSLLDQGELDACADQINDARDQGNNLYASLAPPQCRP